MKSSVILLSTILLAPIGAATGLGGAAITESQLTNQWQEIAPKGNTICSDGSPYKFYHQKGSSDNLHIFFQPGGACWDEESCNLPVHWQDKSKHVEGGIYYADALNMNEAAFQTGIYRKDNPHNPLNDWNKVVVTYCSGDVHIGDAVRTYQGKDGETKTIYHNGQNNTKSVLAWVKEHYPQADKVLVSGESAGGHGAIYYLPAIAKMFPNSQIFQLSDGNALTTERFQEITNWWGVNAEQNFGFKTTNNTMNDGYLHALALFKDESRVTMMQQNTLRDRAMVGFQARTSRVAMSDAVKARWQQDMVYATLQLKQASHNNYYFWISNCQMDEESKLTPHCMEWLDIFYTCKQDGLTFNQWLDNIINHGKRSDIGEQFLPSPLQ